MTLRAFALAAISALSLAASVGIAHADRLEDIRSNGTVRIAIDPAAPPYSAMNEQGQYAGFEVEVARRLAQDWGVTLKIVPSTPANRIPYLITNQADLVVSTLSITDERKQVIDFSQPYSGIQIVVGAPEAVNERSKLTRLQHLILTRLSDGKAPMRAALI